MTHEELSQALSKMMTPGQAVDAYKSTPLYPHTAAYAKEHQELDTYRASKKANIACRDAIEQAILENYANNHLDTGNVLAQVEARFGRDRIEYVLAATVQSKDWDGRFSRDNKEWAKSVVVAERSYEYTVNQAHPILVDALVTRARKEFSLEQERKPSVRDKLRETGTKATAPSTKTKSKQEVL